MGSNYKEICFTCGHIKQNHIYEEGSCRPGYECASECKKFISHKYMPMSSDQVADFRIFISSKYRTAVACRDERRERLDEPMSSYYQGVVSTIKEIVSFLDIELEGDIK